MPDREKVIKGLEYCDFGGSGFCYEKECPYYQNHDCTDELKNDIFALLKEQGPVKPISRFNKLLNETIYWCGKCEAHIENYQSYCGCCGRRVKWDA